MNRLSVYKTNRGRYSVRPIDWTGLWDKYGRIQENGLNHIAIFSDKEDAEFFVKAKEADEQDKMLILPCVPGDTVWLLHQTIQDKFEHKYSITKMTVVEQRGNKLNSVWFIIDGPYGRTSFSPSSIGKTIFLTEYEAQKALERMR